MSGISKEQEEQIKELLIKGEKIAAVKLYREITSLGLKEAKDALEAIERGEPVRITVPVQDSSLSPTLENEIKHLLANRKKIEAVKLYREAHNCGLKDAKDAVDLIQIQMRKDGFTPTISNDPFADEKIGARRRLIIFMVVFLLIALSAIVFFKQGGF